MQCVQNRLPLLQKSQTTREKSLGRLSDGLPPWVWAWDARTRRPQAGPRGWSIFGPNANLIFAKTFEGKIACKLQEAITFSFWIVMT